jgi:hypothetical protein
LAWLVSTAVRGLEQEPGATVGFVDPGLDQTRGSDICGSLHRP